MFVCTRQITFHTPALELDSMLSSIGHHRSYHKIQLGLSAVFPKLPSSRAPAQDEIHLSTFSASSRLACVRGAAPFIPWHQSRPPALISGVATPADTTPALGPAVLLDLDLELELDWTAGVSQNFIELESKKGGRGSAVVAPASTGAAPVLVVQSCSWGKGTTVYARVFECTLWERGMCCSSGSFHRWPP
jgi:hypothetical protein